MSDTNDKLHVTKYSISMSNCLNICDSNINFDDEEIKYLLTRYDNNLMLSFDTNKLLNKLPQFINKLILCLSDYDNVKIDNLPPNIKELCILSDNCNICTYFNNTIDNLPLILEILVIDSLMFDKSIDYLPISLKKLVIKSYNFNQSLDNLPPNLEFLEINLHPIYSYYIDYQYSLYNLPLSIKTLKISSKFIIHTDMDKFKNDRPGIEIEIFNHNKIIIQKTSLIDKLFNEFRYKHPLLKSVVMGLTAFGIGFAQGYLAKK